jgi:hypothetical protein
MSNGNVSEAASSQGSDLESCIAWKGTIQDLTLGEPAASGGRR